MAAGEAEIKMEDTVPAFAFVGQLVKVTTNIQKGEFEDGVDEFGEADAVSVILLGTILDSDGMYLTLGSVDEEGNPTPKIAIKHKDIRIIELYEEGEEGLLEATRQGPDESLN
jgi:hypothetical protein